MYDGSGTPEARYWIARNKLRSEFGLSAEEADREDAEETVIHFKVWEMVQKRQEWEQQRAESRSKMRTNT